jgi:hypothetical protein
MKPRARRIGEKPTLSTNRLNIADVCSALDMRPMPIIGMIRAEKWVVG